MGRSVGSNKGARNDPATEPCGQSVAKSSDPDKGAVTDLVYTRRPNVQATKVGRVVISTSFTGLGMVSKFICGDTNRDGSSGGRIHLDIVATRSA